MDKEQTLRLERASTPETSIESAFTVQQPRKLHVNSNPHCTPRDGPITLPKGSRRPLSCPEAELSVDFNCSLSFICADTREPMQSPFLTEASEDSDQELDEGLSAPVSVPLVANATKNVHFQKRHFAKLQAKRLNTTGESMHGLTASMILFNYRRKAINALAYSGYLCAPLLEFSKRPKATVATERAALYINQLLTQPICNWLAKTPVKLVSCGLRHGLLLTAAGTVMAWGVGEAVPQPSDFPQLVPGLSRSVLVCAGAYHSAAVTLHGSLYTWGRGDVHQLGIPQHKLMRNSKCSYLPTPTKLTFFNKRGIAVVQVACGEAHTLVLDANGKVYAFGWAEEGQLGLEPIDLRNNVMSFAITQVALPCAATKVAVGSLFSCCVGAQGELFVWGNGEHGQLGLGRDVQSLFKPVHNQKLKGWAVDVACGDSHVLCMTQDRTVYGWGLGTDTAGGKVACYLPLKLTEVDAIHRVLSTSRI